MNLENKRPAPRLTFEIILPAKDRTPEVVMAKLASPLAAGGAASLPLTGGGGCRFEARRAFEDFRDAGEVDLRNDGHIVLVD